MKTSETATALRELAKGFKDKDYFVCDSGDYTLADTQAEIVTAMEEAADKLEEQAARIRLWSARADELRKRCDYWYKLGKPVEDQKREAFKWLRKVGQIKIDQKTGWLWFEELARFKESGKCGGSCQLCYMLGKGCALETRNDEVKGEK